MVSKRVLVSVLGLVLGGGVVLFAQEPAARGGDDYGDAPDPTYPTLFASDGARHRPGPLFLGLAIDYEGDGQPDPTATGDDLANSDDEDGVVFTSTIDPGQAATVDVLASMPGFLDAWIDFDGNGSWSDPGEQVFLSQPVVAGVNSLVFAVPQSAVANGTIFARFRLSSTGKLLPTGSAVDGEVEDYAIATVPVELVSFTVD